VPEKLERLAVANLELKELAVALLSIGGQQPHQLGPHRREGVSCRRTGHDILYFRDVPVVELRDYIAGSGLLAADVGKVNCASAWANHIAGPLAQNGRSRTASLDILAGVELSAVFILCRGHQYGTSVPVAGLLRAGRMAVCFVGGIPSVSRPPLPESGDGVAVQ
jgi:hypothetical protein